MLSGNIQGKIGGSIYQAQPGSEQLAVANKKF